MPRYESKGTWFDPAEAAKREGWLPTWANIRFTLGGGVLIPAAECKPVYVKDTKPMTNQTKVSIPAAPWCPPTIAPVAVQITTPAGATINAEEAALSVDALDAIARDFTPIAPGCVSHATRVRMRLSELHGICDTHRRERDEARAERNTFQGQVNTTRQELQHALAELADARAAKDFYKKRCHELVYGSAEGVAKSTPDSLDHLRCVLARELPIALSSEVTSERVDGVPLGTIKIVIQEGTGKPAPAVTKDTVVTLGMLQSLHLTSSNIADEQWERAREASYQRRCEEARLRGRPTPERPRASPLRGSTMVTAIDRKLAGK